MKRKRFAVIKKHASFSSRNSNLFQIKNNFYVLNEKLLQPCVVAKCLKLVVFNSFCCIFLSLANAAQHQFSRFRVKVSLLVRGRHGHLQTCLLFSSEKFIALKDLNFFSCSIFICKPNVKRLSEEVKMFWAVVA